LKPRVPFEELDARVNKLLRDNGKASLKNILRDLLPSSLIETFIEAIEFDPYITGAKIDKDMRTVLVSTLKDFRLNVVDSEGYKRAVVNIGGVEIKEIDPMTMKSKLIDNLYLIGDIIDVFGPTGGFNLQICWSTAFTAIKDLEK
jgi:hypothetical protein